MKSKNGFTVVGILIALMVIIIVVSIFLALILKKGIERNDFFGRQINTPAVGQIYLVTASDPEVNEVIAMPYKVLNDNDMTKTDRRLLLKVKQEDICKKGVWFVKSADGKESIISPPMITNVLHRVESH